MNTEKIYSIKSNVKLFKALSDMSRVRILKMLQCCPLCVCEITFVLNMATSTVSKHLSILRDAGFIIDEKDGKWVNYKINNSATTDIKKLLSFIKQMSNNDPLIINDIKLLKKADRNEICKTEIITTIQKINRGNK